MSGGKAGEIRKSGHLSREIEKTQKANVKIGCEES